MKYKVTHTTTYSYSEPVAVCHNQLLLAPRDLPRQHCLSHRILIRPHPVTSTRHKDYFGNTVYAFSIEEGHRKLTVKASSRVAVREQPKIVVAETPNWEDVVGVMRKRHDSHWFEASQFLFDSPSISRFDELGAYAKESFQPKTPIVQAALHLTDRIHKDFAYKPGTTTVNTTLREAFDLKTGVCQDFAHLQIGCLRALGIPARYVSGYLRTLPPPGKQRLVGSDQSHAWLSIYIGSGIWIDFDPTNNVMCGSDHVTLAWGRDYSDVCPIKGTFVGGGTHMLSVSVDVMPLDEARTTS